MMSNNIFTKTLCSISALGMLLTAVPKSGFAYESLLPYTVYNLTFDDQSSGELLFNLDTTYSEKGRSGRSLSVKAGENNEIFKTTLNELQVRCKSKITFYIKPECDAGEQVNLKLIGRINVNNVDNDYVLESKTVKGASWQQLSGTIDSTFINSGSPIQILISVDSGGQQLSFDIDDFTVVSEKEGQSTGILPVPDIKSQYNGNLLMRASFEKPTLDMFFPEGGDMVVTDEVPAHSGTYCLKISNRTADWENVVCRLIGIEPHAKFTVSAWVKKDPSASSMSFAIQEELSTLEDGWKWRMYQPVSVSDDGWHYIEATIDGNAYPSIEFMGFRITPGDGNRKDYYVDDFIIKSDVPGQLYDDLDYVEGKLAEGMSSTPPKASPVIPTLEDNVPILKEVFKDYFKIGACSNVFSNRKLEDSTQGKLIAKHFNSIVHDGAFKFSNLLDQTRLPERVYTFKEGDAVMDFAKKYGIEDIAGHTLCWESPTTFSKMVLDDNGDPVDLDTAHVIMKEYVEKCIRHFEGDGDPEEYQPGMDYSDWHVSVWDMVNEAVFAGDQVYAKRYGFQSIMGDEYIYWFFKYANDLGYDDVQYRYNDYGEQDTGKRIAVYELIKRLHGRGLRVDCLGMQSHYRVNVLPSQIRKAFEYYSSLDVELDCTELDLSAYTDNQVQRRELLYEDGLPIEVEINQANFYYELFQIYREYSDSIGRVVFWSIDDASSYQNRSDHFNRTDYAGIFDRNYKVKPQFWAIADPDYYFENILKEDTSEVRVVIDGITLNRDEYSIKERDGVTYIKCAQLLDNLGIEYVKINGKYSFIGKGIYMEIGEGAEQRIDFKQQIFNAPAFTEDGDFYVPIMEVCSAMGYTTEYNEKRNIVGVSSNQVSNSL